MLEAAKAAIEEADVLIVVIDGRAGLTAEDARVFERVKAAKRPALLAINKVDDVKKPLLLPLIDRCAKLGLFTECIPISALTGEQLPVLLTQVMAMLPEGPQWYGPEQRTDQTTIQRISELIREQLLLATRQEVPHSVAVMVDQIEEKERVTTIQATILVERPGQKAIVIGKGGGMLKRIGSAARRELERFFRIKVFLELGVEVRKNWRKDEHALRELGFMLTS